MKNKLFALLVVMILAVSVMTVAAFAAEEEAWTPCADGCWNYGFEPVVEQVFPTCTTDGQGGIYACKECGGLYTNMMGMGMPQDPANLEAMKAEQVWPADGYSHVPVHVEAKEATCTENGNIEYWFCEECLLVATDEWLYEVSNFKSVVIAAGCKYNAEHVEATEATCHGKGNVEYWYCEDCDVFYLDEECTEVTAYLNVVIPEKGSENVKYFEAVEATCHDDGNVEYWHCADCDMVWTDKELTKTSNLKSVIVPAKGSDNLAHIEAIAPGCHFDGTIEHWICYDCGKVWTDEDLTEVSNVKNVIVPAIGGEVVHVEAVAPGCNEGNIEHWYCEECEQVWQDEALTQLTNHMNVKLAPVHEKEYFEAVEAVCHQNGNKEYWYCAECDVVYEKDDKGNFVNSNIKNVVILATTELTYVEKVEAGCHTNGNYAYYICEDCGIIFDENMQVSNIKRVTIPADNTLEYTAAVEAGLHTNGMKEYWYCAECDMFFTDAEGKYNIAYLRLVTLAEHGLVFQAGYEASCHQTGMLDAYYCADCDAYFVEEEGNMINIARLSLVIPALNEVEHVEAKAPCCQDGNAEYWYCTECDAVFADAALTQLTNRKNLTIPANKEPVLVEGFDPTCHQNGMKEHYYCADCDVYYVEVEGNLVPTARLSLVIPAENTMLHVEGIEASCHSTGNLEYWYCEECDCFFTDAEGKYNIAYLSLVIPATGCENIIHFEAVEPGCHYNGNIEYWFCPDCESYYQDPAGTQLTNAKRVILPALGGEVIHFEAVEPGCHSNGNIEYWFCAECEQFWADEALTQVTNSKSVILPAKGGEVIHFEAVAPGCHYIGNIEYWFCAECEGFWADEALTQLTNSKNVILPALGGEVKHVAAVAPTETENGNIEYWYCEECEQFWQDEALTQLTNSKNVILPATGEIVEDCEHELVHVEAAEAGCHSLGNIEHWFCSKCEIVWADEALTQITNQLSVILPATGSENVEYFEAVDATCHGQGVIEHWYCADCDTLYADEACTIVINNLSIYVPAIGSENVVYVEAKEATATENGNVEYWYCPDCDSYYLDAECTQLTNAKNVIIPATDSVPETGDSIMTFVMIATVSAMALACVVILNKKKFF